CIACLLAFCCAIALRAVIAPAARPTPAQAAARSSERRDSCRSSFIGILLAQDQRCRQFGTALLDDRARDAKVPRAMARAVDDSPPEIIRALGVPGIAHARFARRPMQRRLPLRATDR